MHEILHLNEFKPELLPVVSLRAVTPLTVLLMASKMEQAKPEQAVPVLTTGLVSWDLPGRREEQDSLVSGGPKAVPLAVTTA